MSMQFLNYLAAELKADKNAACRRAIQRILAMVKKNYEAGEYGSETEAEHAFRHFVQRQGTCRKSKAVVTSVPQMP
jgi:hypothetical protein